MSQIWMPIINEELPPKEECLAKLEDIFNNVDFTRLLNLHIMSCDDSRYGFEQLIFDLYPAYRKLTKFEQSYLGAYLNKYYTLDIDYLEYEAIIPEEREIYRRSDHNK